MMYALGMLKVRNKGKIALTTAILVVAFFIAEPAFAGWVNGYTRSDGTYVSGYYRSSPSTSSSSSYSLPSSSPGKVKVEGYYRKDGTYVRPHYRSAPDSYKWNNYGPSQSDGKLLNPESRDYDGDGTPNYLDSDDDNDGYSDDSDSSQYSPWGW